MVNSSSNWTSTWRLEIWIGLGSLIALTGCVIGVVAYVVCIAMGAHLGWGAQMAHEPFLSGRKSLVDARDRDAKLTDAKMVDAVKEFDKSIAINPLNAPALYHQAKVYERQGKSDLALAGYTDAIDHDKEIAKMDRAEREELHAIPLGIELAGAYLHRATLRNDRGQTRRGYRRFQRSLES